MNDTTEGKKMPDKIEKTGKSIIHHGKLNNRIYVMQLAQEDVPEIIYKLEEMAGKEGYSKIFAKIRPEFLPYFLSDNYSIEAFVPGFYKNEADGIFISKFRDEKRKTINQKELADFYLLLTTTKSVTLKYKHSLKYVIEKLGPGSAKAISSVFGQVFKTYPFPVFNPEYILETMRNGRTQYFGVREGKKLIGISTAEIDPMDENVEMTDFAVLPEYRGQNLAFRLLVKMEQEMKYSGIKTAYTIARLKEPGMNVTFLKSGYRFTGTLVNNTNIGGSIESMNIFYKKL